MKIIDRLKLYFLLREYRKKPKEGKYWRRGTGANNQHSLYPTNERQQLRRKIVRLQDKINPQPWKK